MFEAQAHQRLDIAGLEIKKRAGKKFCHPPHGFGKNTHFKFFVSNGYPERAKPKIQEIKGVI